MPGDTCRGIRVDLLLSCRRAVLTYVRHDVCAAERMCGLINDMTRDMWGDEYIRA